MRLRSSLLLAPAAFLLVAAGDVVYKLDVNTPADLVFTYPHGPPLPGRLDVYRTGPRVGPDDWETPESLCRRPPSYSVTNQSELTELVSKLRQHDEHYDARRIPNVPTHRGYTYHLLLFNEDSKTVMHFRVFEPSDTNTIWMQVWPRSRTGFCYFNDQIGEWLRSRVKLATNSPAVHLERSGNTNATTKSTNSVSRQGRGLTH